MYTNFCIFSLKSQSQQTHFKELSLRTYMTEMQLTANFLQLYEKLLYISAGGEVGFHHSKEEVGKYRLAYIKSNVPV